MKFGAGQDMNFSESSGFVGDRSSGHDAAKGGEQALSPDFNGRS
jgi:hypothetical protein